MVVVADGNRRRARAARLRAHDRLRHGRRSPRRRRLRDRDRNRRRERHRLAALIVRARTIVTCDTGAAQCGVDFDALGRIDDAAMLVENGTIAAVGGRAEVEAIARGATSRNSTCGLHDRAGLCRRARAPALCRRSGTRFCRAAARREGAAGNALYGRADAPSAARSGDVLRVDDPRRGSN